MKKIMLVDDIVISNFIMKKMIGKFFTNYEIFDYILSSNALEDLNKIKPDFIFLDLNMPTIDGWQFLDIMKGKDIHFPVYILTSSTSRLDLQRSEKYTNVKEFLIKPLNISTLKAILNN